MKEGDAILIKATKGRIELRPAERIPTLKELVAQITPENCHGEIQWGPDVGKEIAPTRFSLPPKSRSHA
jgi:antitoxin MazE